MSGAIALVGLAGAALVAERSSLERGNRLFREGRAQEAHEVYRARARGSERPSPLTAYNLGTTLLTLGATDAEDFLRVAADGADSAAAQRGHYNLGYSLLTRFEDVPPDSAIVLLGAAIASNRTALRLDPADQDARWNLAFAELLLDSLQAVAEDAVARREDAQRDEEGGLVIREVAQLGARRGLEREATAEEIPPPLSEADARALLLSVGPDAESLVRGLLWSHRPDVRPWSEPYPGGNW
jgi:hypothetical protein